MLLYYHFFYDLLYITLIFPAQIYKSFVLESNIFTMLSMILLILWFPIEMFRLNFGYKGNINEAFPEFIAFVIFTIFFTLVFSIVIAINPIKFPHETACYAFNFFFILVELFFSFYLICKFARKQKAHYTLRTEPGLDKDFKLKYSQMDDVRTKRQIEIGTRKKDPNAKALDMEIEMKSLIKRD